MFCNVPYNAVIEEKDVDHSIYEVPLMLQREKMDALICDLLRLEVPVADMSEWQEIIRKLIAPQHRVRIGVVGKYIDLNDAYKSVYEAIIHGGVAQDCGVAIEKIDAEDIDPAHPEATLQGLAGILVREALESAVLKARSLPLVMPVKTIFPILDFAWACRSQPLNSLAMSCSWIRPIRWSSIPRHRIRSSG